MDLHKNETEMLEDKTTNDTKMNALNLRKSEEEDQVIAKKQVPRRVEWRPEEEQAPPVQLKAR